ncbi:MAG TPA: SIMPL domain-containing protein [Bryobacteraceae bacterium]|nr:SIMPL domain-containing protein [Bryobacteraceae bacterium]
MKTKNLFAGLAFTAALCAQTAARPASITAVGDASISVNPDMARVDLGVSTQAGTAQDATQQNATQAGAVVTALQTLLGSTASIKTISYSVSPVYNNPPVGQSATIIGYTVTNIVEATMTDLTLVGKVIDTAIQSGANRVQGISFGLQDRTAPVAQALKLAASRARSQADAIASGLNVHTGSVLHASEGVNLTANPTALGPTAGVASTPIETGMVVVQASVTIEVAITS